MAKRKQGFLSNMEPPHIDELDEAANELYHVRQRRMALIEKETEAAELVLSLMHKHKLQTYEFDGLVVTVDAVEMAKVKRKQEPGEDGDE